MSESHEETEQAADDPASSAEQVDPDPGSGRIDPAETAGSDGDKEWDVLQDSFFPPVQPPSAGFLVQLFLIPMIIVGIIVLVWVLFSWIAHMGTDPRDLVRDLRSLDKSSWQKAFTLSDLLRDPSRSELKRDEKLAQELADVLESELRAGSTEAARIRLRIFLCKCLGEFEVPVGIPQLLKAATLERTPAEIDVRYAALESIAVLAENVGAEKLQAEPKVLELLTQISQEFANDASRKHQKGELRSAAAFALGVIGGDEAIDELSRLLFDPHPNVRYNAALGMSRHGDLRASDVLMTMLDPKNPEVVVGEKSPSEQELKRVRVMVNAIRAIRRLSHYHRAEQLGVLRTRLEKLAASNLPKPVVLEAKETLNELTP